MSYRENINTMIELDKRYFKTIVLWVLFVILTLVITHLTTNLTTTHPILMVAIALILPPYLLNVIFKVSLLITDMSSISKATGGINGLYISSLREFASAFNDKREKVITLTTLVIYLGIFLLLLPLSCLILGIKSDEGYGVYLVSLGLIYLIPIVFTRLDKIMTFFSFKIKI